MDQDNTFLEGTPRIHAGEQSARCGALEQTLDFRVVEDERTHEMWTSLEQTEQLSHAGVFFLRGLLLSFRIHGFVIHSYSFAFFMAPPFPSAKDGKL
jgi:hypothetical protein